MLRCLAVVLLLVAACRASAETKDAAGTDHQAATGPRILVVADETKPMEALAGFLRERGRCQVQSVGQDDLPADLTPYAAAFMYIHGKMQRPCEKALVEYATGGGRLVILHHGLASARRSNPDWLRLTGIAIPPNDHPTHPWRVIGNTTHTLVNLKPGHYITSHGVTYDRTVAYQSPDDPATKGEFPALDLRNTEVFLNQQFTDGREKTVLLGFCCTDPASGQVIMQDRSGWLKPAGKGWVFYLQPGHAESDFRNPNYCQIILNCLTWTPDVRLRGGSPHPPRSRCHENP